MRKTLVLLALAAMLALSAAVFGSPPTVKREKTFKKIQTVKIVKTIAADTSAVATRDAEARTVEAAHVVTLNSNELTATLSIGNVAPIVSAAETPRVAANRYDASPPERLTGNAESRTMSGDNLYECAEAVSPSGYVLRR